MLHLNKALIADRIHQWLPAVKELTLKALQIRSDAISWSDALCKNQGHFYSACFSIGFPVPVVNVTPPEILTLQFWIWCEPWFFENKASQVHDEVSEALEISNIVMVTKHCVDKIAKFFPEEIAFNTMFC